MTERLITDGARALRAYLDKIDKSVPVFCEEHRLDRIQVQKALNGDTQRISVDLGTSLERATEGVVPASAWRSDTLRLSPVGKRKRGGGQADDEPDADAPPVTKDVGAEGAVT